MDSKLRAILSSPLNRIQRIKIGPQMRPANTSRQLFFKPYLSAPAAIRMARNKLKICKCILTVSGKLGLDPQDHLLHMFLCTISLEPTLTQSRPSQTSTRSCNDQIIEILWSHTITPHEAKAIESCCLAWQEKTTKSNPPLSHPHFTIHH